MNLKQKELDFKQSGSFLRERINKIIIYFLFDSFEKQFDLQGFIYIEPLF